MIKIFLIESQKIVREGLKSLLEEESDFKVVASEHQNIKISEINYLQPDLILISLNILDNANFNFFHIFDQSDLTSNKSQIFNHIKTIIFADKIDQSLLNKALQLNCEGYLLKDSSVKELKQAIHSVYNGYKHIGNSFLAQVKQFSFIDKSSAKFLQENVIYSPDYLNSGLIKTNNHQLDYEQENLNNTEILIPKSQAPFSLKPKNNYLVTSVQKYSASKQPHWLHSIASSVLLISLGCAAGIVGVISLKERTAKSFAPIVRYGTVETEVIPIKSNYAGKIKALDLEVGDLVETDEIVAKLESQFYQQQGQIIADFTQQIAKTQEQIKNQNQLLAINKFYLNNEKQKLQQLFNENSHIESTTQSKINETRADFTSVLKDIQEEEKVALSNYQQLQKLKEKKVVSAQELARAKQVWIIAHNKLTESRDKQRQNSLKLSPQEVKVENNKQQDLDHLRENIEQWQTQVRERDNTVKLLKQDLNDARNRLNKVQDSYQKQQLIDIFAPARGVIYKVNQENNELLHEEQTLIELLDCNNLWIEVMVNASLLEKINLQQPVKLEVETLHQNLSGIVSSLHSVQNFNQEYAADLLPQISQLNPQSAKNLLDNKLLFKIKIDFPIPDNHAEQHMFCGWKEAATVTFNSK